ncbi:MAG: NlpC/P60 family protein [Bacteroidales bacterium]|nr:NlpC/P60 family protein [Bacteroidales bacterium]
MKKILSLLIGITVAVTAFAQTQWTELDAAEAADLIIEEAQTHLGKPYKYGARGPKSFDCSGFAGYVYNRFGYTLGRSSRDQALDGREVSGDLSELQKGDLIIFSGRKKGQVGHVGIFIDFDSKSGTGRFIHADKSGVRISMMSEPYYETRVMGVRRILPDFVADYSGGRYPFEGEAQVSIAPDRLDLGEGDLRMVVFESGKWALVDSDGRVTMPGGAVSDRIVLYPDGSWKAVPRKMVKIPTLSGKSEKGGETKNDAASKAAGGDAAASGQQSDIRVEGAGPTSVTGGGTETVKAETPAVYHTIVKGDTLYGISKKYGVSVKTICRLNGISEKTTLHLGRKLRIK